MHIAKKIFTALTGYYIYKVSSLPVGTDLLIDIHTRNKYKSIDTFFDVGANDGQTWSWFRKHGEKGKIYCFEPVSETFEKLKLKTSRDKKCIVENIALGEAIGKMKISLHDGENSVLNSLNPAAMNSDPLARTEEITINTIDNYCLQNQINKIDLLKVDTEGYEMTVLKGATGMLDAAKIAMVYCEVGFTNTLGRTTNFSLLTEWMEAKGYYFFGMYQIMLALKSGFHYANALYIHKDYLKHEN